MAEETLKLNTLADRLTAEFSLIKMSISVMSAAAAVAGYSMHQSILSKGALWTAAGVFLLAAGSSVLNNFQDRFSDSRMERTKMRPLPSGKVHPADAVFITVILISAGSIILKIISGSYLPSASGLLAVFLYNGIYTHFRAYRLLSFFSGLACGMLPPMIGWFAAGGTVLSMQIIFYMVLLGVWQVPHTWLIILGNREDYKKAGVVTVVDMFTGNIMKMMLFLWVLFFGFVTLLVKFFFYNLDAVSTVLLCVNALLPVTVFLFRTAAGRDEVYHPMFHLLNFSMMSTTLLIVYYSLYSRI